MGVKADLGTVLRELRKRSGHTQTSAANAATEYLEKLSETVALKEAERSITGSALSYQERKEKEEEQKKEPQTPNVFVLLALAHVYGVSLGDVFAELGVSSKEICGHQEIGQYVKEHERLKRILAAGGKRAEAVLEILRIVASEVDQTPKNENRSLQGVG